MHNCRSALCITPHYEDDHPDECSCLECHASHRWQAWTIYPECDYCEQDMLDDIWPLIEEAEKRAA